MSSKTERRRIFLDDRDREHFWISILEHCYTVQLVRVTGGTPAYTSLEAPEVRELA